MRVQKDISTLSGVMGRIEGKSKFLHKEPPIAIIPWNTDMGNYQREIKVNSSYHALGYHCGKEFYYEGCRYVSRWEVYEIALNSYKDIVFAEVTIKDSNYNKVKSGTVLAVSTIRNNVGRLKLDGLNEDHIASLSDVRILKSDIDDIDMLMEASNPLMAVMSLSPLDKDYPIFLSFGLDNIFLKNFYRW